MYCQGLADKAMRYGYGCGVMGRYSRIVYCIGIARMGSDFI